MTDYGLPQSRDEDGSPDPVEHEYEWDGEAVVIQIRPPMLEQLKRYQELGEDAAVEELEEIVDRHIEKPERPAAKMTEREISCYMYGIRDYGSGGGGDEMQQVREAIAEREGRQGNP